MTRRSIVLICALALALVAGPVAAAPTGASQSSGPPPARGGEIVDGSYLVVLDTAHPSSVARQHAAAHGADVRHVYSHALQGYAARMSERAASQVARDPRVLRVEPDRVEELLDVPTGVDRIEADRAHDRLRQASSSNEVDAGDVHVAVLDSGITDHPDLTVAGGRNFANGPASRYDDKNGHGTHVAGTIGARDGATAGVAPGANLWALRVCNQSCYHTDIVAGIDWMVRQKQQGATDFAAANFSISSADTTAPCDADGQGYDIVHTAICGAVDAGIVFVLAAGNDNRHKQPFPEALSVSAIADFDGLPGGAGSATCRTDTDDMLANFSNFGANIKLAAPGVCITSTWNDGGYATISGTSMATPHVTGAVALYVHANGGTPGADAADVAAIEQALLGDAVDVGSACGYEGRAVDEDGGISIVDGGPLLFLNGGAFGGDGTCGPAGPGEPVEPVTDLAVTGVEVPTSFDQGSAAPPVAITVANEGTEAVDGPLTLDLEVTADGATDPVLTDAVILQTDDLPAPGSSASVDWAWNTTELAVGSYTVTATLAIDDADGSNDAGSAGFTVVAPDDGDPDPTGEVAVTLRDASWTAGPWWRATVEVAVTLDEQGLSGATVDLTWSGDLDGAGTCITDGGSCQLELGRLRSPSAGTAVTVDTVHVDGVAVDDAAILTLSP